MSNLPHPPPHTEHATSGRCLEEEEEYKRAIYLDFNQGSEGAYQSLSTPTMDFQGQKLSEYLYYYIIIIFGVIGWIYGWWEETFLPTFYAWAAGLIISLIICCPDWPIYNRHPVQWLKEFPRPSDQPSSSSSHPPPGQTSSSSGGSPVHRTSSGGNIRKGNPSPTVGQNKAKKSS